MGWGGIFVKNREDLKDYFMNKGREKWGKKKKRVIKYTLKYHYEA